MLDLIEALGRFDDSSRPTLTLVGAPKPDSGTHHYLTEDDLAAFSREQGITIDLTGYLPPQAASDRLAACSALSLPFPNGATQRSSALIAALSLGRPVVTTSRDLQSELDGLSDLPQLIAVPPGDVDALKEGLESALATDIPPATLPPQYRWTSIGAQHAALYDELAGRGGGARA